jgi:uncharacterized caspase-like protein
MLHLLAIGIDRYADTSIQGLSCARSDAEAVATLFERGLLPDDCRVRVLADERATARNVRLAVDGIHSVLGPDDVVLVYFAGHGSPERVSPRDNPGRYLLVHDTVFEHIHATSLSMESDVGDWLTRLGSAKLLLIVLDCCFSGRAGGRTVMGPLLRAAGLKMLDDDRLVSLKSLDLGHGRIILCASDDNQLAEEDRELGHGIFTSSFLDALTRERPGKSTVPLTHLYEEVAREVREKTQGAQEPVATFIPVKGAALPVLPRRAAFKT